MRNFENAWSFAKAHPFISLWALQAVVSGVVSVTRALTKPFVKTPEYGLDDVVRAVMAKVNEDKPEEESAEEEVSEVVEINPEPALIEAE